MGLRLRVRQWFGPLFQVLADALMAKAVALVAKTGKPKAGGAHPVTAKAVGMVIGVGISVGMLYWPGAVAWGQAEIQWGDNGSAFANDGVCNDPRFSGPEASLQLEALRYHDATDCRTLYAAGLIALDESEDPTVRRELEGIDFGDNSSRWAHDDECDDPRFEGEGMAHELSKTNLYKDAADCRTLYERRKIRIRRGPTASAAGSWSAAA